MVFYSLVCNSLMSKPGDLNLSFSYITASMLVISNDQDHMSTNVLEFVVRCVVVLNVDVHKPQVLL